MFNVLISKLVVHINTIYAYTFIANGQCHNQLLITPKIESLRDIYEYLFFIYTTPLPRASFAHV